MPTDVLEHLCNNKRIITGAKPFPYAIAMGVDVDSINVSDHVEFDASLTSYLGETMAKRMLEGIQSRLDVRKYSFSQRTINVWNNLSTDCVHASSVNMFKNKIDKYLVKAGYT